MKFAAYTISGILILGGVAGLLNQRHYTYPVTGRYGSIVGSRTMDKEGARLLAVGSIALGLACLGATIYFSLKGRKAPNHSPERRAD